MQQFRNFLFGSLVLIFMLSALPGCSNSPDSSTPDQAQPEELPQAILTPYDFANGCYAVQSEANKLFMVVQSGAYKISGADQNAGMAFFMKPAALGQYLLFDRDGGYLDVDPLHKIIRSLHADQSAVWELKALGDNSFALHSPKHGAWLAISPKGSAPVLSFTCDAACAFRLLPGQDCQTFPEAELNIDIPDKDGNPVNPLDAMARPAVGEPIIGFADIHVHLNHFLASGQTTFVGETFNPLGIQEALRDCSPLHGKNGSTDILGMVQSNSFTNHNTDGWPTFSFWPTAKSQTHQQAYYRWIERAWLSGQRLMVQEMVNAEILAKVKNGLIKPKVDIMPQDDISVVDRQIKNMYDMQDYIDAQCGGPGKGWFRICKSSNEARQVINQGKMAVILAIEVDSLCNAGKDYCEDYGTCDDGRNNDMELDAKLNNIEYLLDKYYDLGIRTIFPVHGINNGYGGAWLYVNMVWDLGNKIMRGNFYDIEASPNPRVTYQETGIEYTAAQALTVELLKSLGIDLPYAPVIPPDLPPDAAGKGHANGQGLTKLGEWLIEKLIDKGFVIEVDHMSDKTINRAIEIIWEHKYPGVIATHGGITDLEPPDAKTHEQLDIPRMIKVIQLGGLFSAHIGGQPRTSAGPAMYGDDYCYLDYLRFMINLSKKGPGTIEALDNENAREKYFYYHEGKPYMVPTSWYNTNDDPTDDLVLGQPMTTDVNGACSLPLPDQSPQNMVDYDSGGFGVLYPGLYNESVVDNSNVRFHRQVTGNRTFDVNKDGMAHYGLMPDYIKYRQVQDPNLQLNAFFRGTEAYLRMLNRVERYHNDPNYPSRDPQYWDKVNYEDWWNWKKENQ
jgi:hypothetical protein